MRLCSVISIFSLFFFLFLPCSALSQSKQGKVTDLKENEKAPFAGTLLSPVAYAKIVVEKKYEHSKKILKMEEELERQKLKSKLKLEAKEDKLNAVREGYKSIQKRDEEEIKFLRKYSMKNGPSGGQFWTGFGLGTGFGAAAITTIMIIVNSN